MKRKVAQFIASQRLMEPGGKVLVAVSGGADSVALLRVLLALGYTCEAAHCNFSLRGAESLRDEAFVRSLCATLQVPLHVARFDTRREARTRHVSIEMAARELRYGWFEQLRSDVGAAVIAVAHHRDDSVETILLNLIRGTGISGLCGIRPRNGYVVRPLLCTSREEITAYLQAIGQPYVTDSTNLQPSFTRNKIRLRLLPLMEEMNPSVRQSLVDMATRLTDVALVYRHSMDEARQRVQRPEGIDIAALQREPAPAALLFELLHPLGFNAAQTASILHAVEGQAGKVFLSKEWRVVKDRNLLLVTPRVRQADEENKDEGDGEKFYADEKTVIIENREKLCADNKTVITENGKTSGADSKTVITDNGKTSGADSKTVITGNGKTSGAHDDRPRLRIETFAYTADFNIPRTKDTACFDADKLQQPLTLRRWQRGDSFVPFGMHGRKMVSDYFTDHKFSLPRKEKQWLLCCGDAICWLVGERVDNRFKVDSHTKQVMLVTLLPPDAER
ncbi:MAG: tRNA lysidine(34) synthetase TilS [Prevotellaceae bacterium]|nr:tRNA lysidine(34) synthetase TilS [Prevotellaceae bacterium]